MVQRHNKVSKPINIRLNMTGSSHTEKSCIALSYGQFSTNIIIKIIKLILVLIVYPSFGSRYDPAGLDYLGISAKNEI